jgi:hypothetical protein
LSERNTTTQSAWPVAMAAAPLATAAQQPPPPPPHCMVAERRRGSPSAEARRVASLRSSPYEAKPSMWRGSRPGVGAGAQHGLQRQLELGIGRLAVLVVVRLADADDRDTALQCALGHRWDRIRQ